MATEPTPQSASEPRYTKSSSAFLLGCVTAPLICILELGIWALTYVFATGPIDWSYWPITVQIAIVVLFVHCLISTILGAAAGAAVAKSNSLFKSAGISALVSFPFGIALGTFCNRSFPQAFVAYGLLVTFAGTFTGMIVTAIMRRSEKHESSRRLQVRLGEMLFVCMLVALFLIVLGMEYRRMRAMKNQPVKLEEAINGDSQ